MGLISRQALTQNRKRGLKVKSYLVYVALSVINLFVVRELLRVLCWVTGHKCQRIDAKVFKSQGYKNESDFWISLAMILFSGLFFIEAIVRVAM